MSILAVVWKEVTKTVRAWNALQIQAGCRILRRMLLSVRASSRIVEHERNRVREYWGGEK